MGKNQRCTRSLMMAAAGLVLLGACERNSEERQRQAAVDSMAEARARGEIDLSNPEMGAKVLITLGADSIAQSHETIPPGQVTFAVQNQDTVPHIFQILGTSGAWRTQDIPAGSTVLMSMVIEPGQYDMFCPDSAGKPSDRCGAMKKIATR